MTSDGSPSTRFQRAVRAQNLALIHATAAELPHVPLRDALAILLVVDGKHRERFDPAAVKWVGRLALETPNLALAELGALQSLVALPDQRAQRSLLALAERARRPAHVASGRSATQPAGAPPRVGVVTAISRTARPRSARSRGERPGGGVSRANREMGSHTPRRQRLSGAGRGDRRPPWRARVRRAGVELEHVATSSLGVVFDHVAIAVSDLSASERFYRTVLSVLGAEPSRADAELVEWDDWDIMRTDREHPVTRGLHVGFRAPSHAAVNAFWQAGIDAGYRDDGAPGPRTQYGPDYYGGFLLDPDGNSVEAVHGERARPVPDGCVDHLWIRVADLAASKRFYTTIAPHAGIRLGDDEPGRVQLTGEDYSFSLINDERPLTEHVHLAFPARDDATVRAFHDAALAAGYSDHGSPGERPMYHRGYYGAFVLDPDGHNVEVVNHNR